MLARRGIKLLVCDMAGTVVNENNIVYRSLDATLRELGINTPAKEQRSWHGQAKSEVLRRAISSHRPEGASTEILIHESKCKFNRKLHEAYFENDTIELMDHGLLDRFEALRCNGVKIALNTGYSRDIQRQLCNKLHLTESVDAMIAADQVRFGRPYPYMVHRLMEICSVSCTRNVAKIGDTSNDVLEGRNAGCALVVGVLSGAGNRDDLVGADEIVNSIMELEVGF